MIFTKMILVEGLQINNFCGFFVTLKLTFFIYDNRKTWLENKCKSHFQWFPLPQHLFCLLDILNDFFTEIIYISRMWNVYTFIYTCEMKLLSVIFFPMQYLNKNLWDAWEMFFLFLQVAPDLYHAWEKKRETINNSQIMKFRKENSDNNYKASGYCYSIQDV